MFLVNVGGFSVGGECQCVVFLFARDAVQCECVAQRIVRGGEAEGDAFLADGQHLPGFCCGDRVAKVDFTRQGQIVRRGDDRRLRLHCEGARLHAEGEAEFLQTFFYPYEVSQTEDAVIEFAGLQCSLVGHELNGVVVQPMRLSVQGGGEAKWVFFQFVQVYHG